MIMHIFKSSKSKNIIWILFLITIYRNLKYIFINYLGDGQKENYC